MFFHLGENWFFKNIFFQKKIQHPKAQHKKKSTKIRFSKKSKISTFLKIWKFSILVENLKILWFWILDFFENIFFWKINFLQDEKIFFTLCFFNALVHTSIIQKTYLENSQCLQGGKRFGAGTCGSKTLFFKQKSSFELVWGSGTEEPESW